jgi:hypothetical protein
LTIPSIRLAPVASSGAGRIVGRTRRTTTGPHREGRAFRRGPSCEYGSWRPDSRNNRGAPAGIGSSGRDAAGRELPAAATNRWKILRRLPQDDENAAKCLITVRRLEAGLLSRHGKPKDGGAGPGDGRPRRGGRYRGTRSFPTIDDGGSIDSISHTFTKSRSPSRLCRHAFYVSIYLRSTSIILRNGVEP